MARYDRIEATKLLAARKRTADSFVGSIFYGFIKSSRVWSHAAPLRLILVCSRSFSSNYLNEEIFACRCPQLVGTNVTVHDVECTTCSCRTDRSKLDSIAVAPRVLQLQIKRIATDSSGLCQLKSNTPVDFPLVLQIRESQLDGKTRPPAVYDLHAVSLHLGTPGTPTAHFITFVRR